MSDVDGQRPEMMSNREAKEAWPIDVNQDPYEIPLEEMNPAHIDLFEAGTMLPWFERLRKEAPVHYCANSQFGPYWSVTTYDDIQYIDSHHELFSSDIVNGGIRLGGVAVILGKHAFFFRRYKRIRFYLKGKSV